MNDLIDDIKTALINRWYNHRYELLDLVKAIVVVFVMSLPLLFLCPETFLILWGGVSWLCLILSLAIFGDMI